MQNLVYKYTNEPFQCGQTYPSPIQQSGDNLCTNGLKNILAELQSILFNVALRERERDDLFIQAIAPHEREQVDDLPPHCTYYNYTYEQERETDTQTDTQTDSQRDRHTDRHTD